MLPGDLNSVEASLSSFLSTYVEPYVTVMVMLGILLWAGVRLDGRARFGTAKRAVLGEVKLNLRVCEEVISYVEAQKVGTPYSLPMPRFYATAFDNLRSQGYLYKLKKEFRDELLTIYMTIERVHAASTRQEDLAVGPGAASPLASDLRSQNLAFILGNVTNIIQPQLSRLDTLRSKR
jgi:hypothetical protein